MGVFLCPILPIVGLAMNQGCSIEGAGPVHLNGMKTSWNSPPASEIVTFDQFLDIFFVHWKWTINSFFNSLMNTYGSLWNYCPSPLFSAFLEDSLETGRDLTNGGARYHIVAPMMCGIANAINALFCLQCNWGNDMIQPFYTTLEGELRRESDAQFYHKLREYALAVPKFGVSNNPALNDLARQVVERAVQVIHDAIDKPIPAIQKGYQAIQSKYGTPERPFAFTITPGVGTFEDNVGLGMDMGASADGRLNGQPIADDFCATPWPDDLPLNMQLTDPFVSLKRWNIHPINHGIANAAPIDLNIPENFPLDKLTAMIRDFTHSRLGSNMITVTCADPQTFEGAMRLPERYDLVRVRMGGWTEFYIAMFDFHQQSILRRPYYSPLPN